MARARLIRLEDLQQFTAINLLADPGAIGGPLVVPNCWRVRLNFTLTSGAVGHCNLYGRTATTVDPTVSQADAVFASLGGATWTALAAHIAPTASFSGVSLQNVHFPNKPFVDSTGPAKPGTSTGTALPDETAACITFRTALTGTSGRGRIFVPGWATTALGAGNVIAAPAVTALQGWANVFGSALSSNTMTHCLALPARNAYISPVTGTSHPARAARTEVVTGVPVRDNHWDSQRRRGLH